MRSYEAAVTIAATPERIWSILTDASGYTSWDSGVTRLDGRIAPGEKLTIYNPTNPSRGFPAQVVELEPGRRMVWSGGMPLGLFKGVRTFTLTPDPAGGTRFHMREEYTGALLAMIWKSMPDLDPFFQRFARGLKQKAERG